MVLEEVEPRVVRDQKLLTCQDLLGFLGERRWMWYGDGGVGEWSIHGLGRGRREILD